VIAKIMKEIEIKDIEALPGAAREFLRELGERRVVAFDAPMGAGKTTFISAVCRELGVEDDISSPTFSIVNEYEGNDGELIYHFDCYRIDEEAEALDMGVEDYLSSGCLCLIEWPEIIERFLPDDTVRVSIAERSDGSRILTVN